MQSTTGVRSHVPLIKAFYLLEDIQTPQMRVDCWDKRITEVSMTLTLHIYIKFTFIPDSENFTALRAYAISCIEFITLDVE